MKIILILISFNFGLFGQIHYVSKTGFSIPPYSSWENASQTIQGAVAYAENGDSILVAEGIYYETLRIYKALTFIGQSKEYTIIDASEISDTTILTSDLFSISGFTLIGSGNKENKVNTVFRAKGEKTIFINCLLKNSFKGIGSIKSIEIDSCDFINFELAVSVSNLTKDRTLKISNSNFYIIGHGNAISASPYDRVIIKGNKFVSDSFDGMNAVFNNAFDVNTLIFKNNQSIGAKNNTIYLEMFVNDSLIIENNTIVSQTNDFETSAAIFVRWPQYVSIRNNIFSDCYRNIILYPAASTVIDFVYNLYWNIENVDSNYLSSTDYLNISPGFYTHYIDFDEPFDLRLEKYSKAINAGDPNMHDVDSTRSDLGAFGGPGGISYEYPDKEPPTVTNLIIDYVSGTSNVELSWNPVVVNDLMRYRVYRDTVSKMVIDGADFISFTNSTNYTDSSIVTSDQYYYYVTAEDSGGQLGKISNVASVLVTEVDNDLEPQPLKFRLYENYPNPFNPQTRIEYSLKSESKVSLEVVDIKGSHVRTLVNEIQRAGYYSVMFDGTNLASGIYFCHIQVQDEKGKMIYSQGNKMLLLK